jgi:hypothetical protein
VCLRVRACARARVCDIWGSFIGGYWKQVLTPCLLESCRRFGRTCFLLSVMSMASYPRVSCSLYMCVQCDSKASIHRENNLFIYKTCSIWAQLHWQHIRMCLSHSWRSRFNASGVMRAHACLMRSFRWSILCIFSRYTMAFKCSHK